MITARAALGKLHIIQGHAQIDLVQAALDLELWKASVLGGLHCTGVEFLRRPLKKETPEAIRAELKYCMRIMLLLQTSVGRGILFITAALADRHVS